MRLVESLCGQALEGYRTGRVNTTRNLMRKAGREAGLSPEEAGDVVQALVERRGEER